MAPINESVSFLLFPFFNGRRRQFGRSVISNVGPSHSQYKTVYCLHAVTYWIFHFKYYYRSFKTADKNVSNDSKLVSVRLYSKTKPYKMGFTIKESLRSFWKTGTVP